MADQRKGGGGPVGLSTGHEEPLGGVELLLRDEGDLAFEEALGQQGGRIEVMDGRHDGDPISWPGKMFQLGEEGAVKGVAPVGQLQAEAFGSGQAADEGVVVT